MTIYDTIKSKLETHPSFRERRFRADGLHILALRALNIEDRWKSGAKLSVDEMVNYATKYDSMRHEYDAVLRDYPELRGEDYSDGKKLAQEKCLSFGYSPGYHNDVGQLRMANA